VKKWGVTRLLLLDVSRLLRYNRLVMIKSWKHKGLDIFDINLEDYHGK